MYILNGKYSYFFTLSRKRLIANDILLKYHRRYRERTSSMYYHWTYLKEKNGKLLLIKCYQHNDSCVCNEENPVNIDQVFKNEYDYVMALIKEYGK